MPVFTVNPVINGNPWLGQTLICTGGTVTGGGITRTYQWLLDGDEIDGATSNSLLITEDFPHDSELSCEVTATNSVGSTTAESTAVTVVWPPVYVSGGSISGGTELDAELTASDPTWSNDPTSTSREWEVNEIPTGETGTTYDDPREDGDSVTCVFYASNAAGSATPYRSNAIIAEDAPDFDPDAQDYISRVETADGQSLEDEVKTAINDLFVALKAAPAPIAATNWDAIKAGTALLMAGPRTLAGALVPLHSSMPTPTNTNFVSGDYNRVTGLKGGTGKRVSLNIRVDAVSISNRGIVTYSSEHHTRSGGRSDISAGNGGINNPSLLTAASNRYFRTGGGEFFIPDSTAVPGFWGVIRSGTTRTGRYAGVESSNSDSGTDAIPAGILTLFSGPTGTQQSDARLICGGYHAAVDLSSADAALTSYMAAIAAALP